jgi:hypothetical protein
MTKVTFTTEGNNALKEWLKSCPRQFANVIFVSIGQVKDDEGTTHYLGMHSIIETDSDDACGILHEMLHKLCEWHDKMEDADH